MESKDVASIAASGIAILLSLSFFFFLNRRHARALFEATQYPDFEFHLLGARLGGGKPVIGHTYAVPIQCIDCEWRNTTKTEAINLYAVITLTRRFRRVRWEERDYAWDTIAPLAMGKAMLGSTISQAMYKLCPEDLVLQSGTAIGGGSATVYWLAVPKGKKPPKLGLKIQFRWQAALWKPKWLKKDLRSTLKPQLGAKGRIDYWTGESRSNKIPLWLAGWRPRTLDPEVERDAI